MKNTEQLPKTNALAPNPIDAWGLYRPDGSIAGVYMGGEMTVNREELILGEAWSEIRPAEYQPSGIPFPAAPDRARDLGWAVAPVAIYRGYEEGRGIIMEETEECETCGGYGWRRMQEWGGKTRDVMCEECDGRGGFLARNECRCSNAQSEKKFPKTTALLGKILDEQGILNQTNAPEPWVNLCREVEGENARLRNKLECQSANITEPIEPTPKCGEPGWIGHEWRMRSFLSDECIHCGVIAVEGCGLRSHEYCSERAKSKFAPEINRRTA